MRILFFISLIYLPFNLVSQEIEASIECKMLSIKLLDMNSDTNEFICVVERQIGDDQWLKQNSNNFSGDRIIIPLLTYGNYRALVFPVKNITDKSKALVRSENTPLETQERIGSLSNIANYWNEEDCKSRGKKFEFKISQSSNQLQIRFDDPDKVYDYQLVNRLGQILSVGSIKDNHKISTQALLSGIYYLHIFSASEHQTQAITIQK